MTDRHMYSDGTDWVIAESLEQANAVRLDAYGQELSLIHI